MQQVKKTGVMLNVLDYYKELIDRLNVRVFSYLNTNVPKFEKEIPKEKLENFSFLAMIREKGNDNPFQWFLTDRQKQYIINHLNGNDKSFDDFRKVVNCSHYYSKFEGKTTEAILDEISAFKFKKSGIINYFNKTQKDVLFINKVQDEVNLTSNGYEEDYQPDENDENRTLREFRDILVKNGYHIDPFIALENIWEFRGSASYVYFKIGGAEDTKSNYEFIGLLPVFNYLKQDFDTKKITKRKIFYAIDNIKSAILGAEMMHGVMAKNVDAVKREAIKSAKAAIMARNMSHNIGSHIMNYLKDQLGDVETALKNNSLKNLINYYDDEKFKIGENLYQQLKELETTREPNKELNDKIEFDKLKEVELPFLIGLGHFINYVQERQDFIATISTDYVPSVMQVNFKEHIFDTINHDYKAIRHKEKLAYKFKGDNIILDNIVRSERFQRDNVKIYYKRFDGLHKNSEQFSDANSQEIDPHVNADFEELVRKNLALPGGTIGRQAFFSILENIIRNAAKHGSSQKENLEVTIAIEEDYDEKCSRDLAKVEITDNGGNYLQAKDKLQEALKDPYIEENTGQLKEDFKGIKEMRISATWLRGLEDEEEAEPPPLQIDKDDNGNLKFIFYLLKPKNLLFITKNTEALKLTGEYEKQLGSKGWMIKSPEDLKKEDFRHRLIVIDNNLDQIKAGFHSRIIFSGIAPESIENALKEIDASNGRQGEESLINRYYKEFIQHNLTNDQEPLPEVLIKDDESKHPQRADKTKDERVHINDNTTKNRIVFKEHLETRNNYNAFFNQSDSHDWKFVESITGSNSTDRLIRKADLDTFWYLNMVEAALTKVVILDERLWRYFTGKEESEVENSSREKENEENDDESVEARFTEEVRKEIAALSENDKARLKAIVKNKEGYPLNDQKSFLKEILRDNNFSFDKITHLRQELLDPKESNSSSGINWNYKLLEAKNVWVYNLLAEKDDEKDRKFSLVGTDCSNQKGINEIFLKKPQDQKGLLQFNGSTILDDVHFLCVHQGLLDKLYGKFSSEFSYEEKQQVIKELQEIFKAQHIIVHSGRSRPSSSDLPSNIPFIQYAALNQAVKDCKYSLTELLYAVRPENTDSNG